jgi:hypothetical protein
MFMPGGAQNINPLEGGVGTPITILVDASGAGELEKQRSALVAKGKRPYFDFNHEDGPASFWPEQFFWQDAPEPGIYARGEWSESGKRGVEGKEWRQFSPVFHVNNKLAKPARIICRETAGANMGGMVNAAAFHNILPLWAKAAGAHSSTNQNDNQTTMTPEELAALQASIKQMEQDVTALKAKSATDANAVSELKAKETELRAAKAEAENVSLKAKNAEQNTAIVARNAADAQTVVDKAVGRGAIAAKDTKTIEALKAKATEDPTFCSVIDAMQGNAALVGGRITTSAAAAGAGGDIRITGVSCKDALKEYGRLVCANSKLGIHDKEKGKLALQMARVYSSELKARENDWLDLTMDEAIKAADYTDPSGNLGTLSGTLVLQRVLPYFQYEYPVIGKLWTDFSDAPGLLNQTENTRVVTKPAVQTYDGTLNPDGRPKGWTTVSPAIAKDVPVTLSQYVGVPIVFGNNVLASTIRRLFDEQAPMALYALGGHFVDMATALMTSANYNAYAVQGAKVPVAYTTFPIALADFNMASLDQLAGAFDTNEVPQQDRGTLLNSSYYRKLRQDPQLNMFFAAQQSPEIITKGRLPELVGFAPYNAPYMPSANNVTGFAFHKAAVVLKARLPQDFTQAVGAMVPGSVTTITDPGTGISVLLVQYVNLTQNYAEWRIEVMLGAAVGDNRGGLVISSQ